MPSGLMLNAYYPGDGIENNPADPGNKQYGYPWGSIGNTLNFGLGFLSGVRLIPYPRRRALAKRVANAVYHFLKGPDPRG